MLPTRLTTLNDETDSATVRAELGRHRRHSERENRKRQKPQAISGCVPTQLSLHFAFPRYFKPVRKQLELVLGVNTWWMRIVPEPSRSPMELAQKLRLDSRGPRTDFRWLTGRLGR